MGSNARASSNLAQRTNKMDACNESSGDWQDVALYNDCIKRRFEPYCIYKTFGRMVELVDTVVSKASAERREGSSPSLTTKNHK